MKNGQMDMSRKTIYYVIALFVLAFMVIYMNNIIKAGNQKDISMLKDASDNLLVAELVTSPNCFAYMDEDLNRVYPGTVDLDRLNEIHSSCARYAERFSLLVNGKNLGDQDLQNGKLFSRPVMLSNGSFGEMKVMVPNV